MHRAVAMAVAWMLSGCGWVFCFTVMMSVDGMQLHASRPVIHRHRPQRVETANSQSSVPTAERSVAPRVAPAPPARVAGRREYGDEALDALRLVLAAQHAGFTLSEIKALLSTLSGSSPSGSWQATAQAKLDEIDATIARLQAARHALANALDCACAGKASACKLVAGASPAARARRSRK